MDKVALDKIFKFADPSGRGALNSYQLKLALTCLFGYAPSTGEIDDLLLRFGHDKVSDCDGASSRVIQREGFDKIFEERARHFDLDDHTRETFKCIDGNCKGFIDVVDFVKAVQLSAPHLDCANIERFFRELDHDNDGRVSFRSFEMMMKHK